MKKEFIISVYTENHIGLLNRITIIFTRRKVNIESLTVSESTIKGVSKFTIVVHDTEERVKLIVAQIEKQVEILKAFYHTDDQMIHQELALYKVSTKHLTSGNQIETIIRQHNARILEVTNEFMVIEKTGHKEETQELFKQLEEFGVLQFIRSGTVAITRSSVEKLSEFIRSRDESISLAE